MTLLNLRELNVNTQPAMSTVDLNENESAPSTTSTEQAIDLTQELDVFESQLRNLLNEAKVQFAVVTGGSYQPPSDDDLPPNSDNNFSFSRYVHMCEYRIRQRQFTAYDSKTVRKHLLAELNNFFQPESAVRQLADLQLSIINDLPTEKQFEEFRGAIERLSFSADSTPPMFDQDFTRKLMRVVVWNSHLWNVTGDIDMRNSTAQKEKGLYLLIKWLITGKLETNNKELLHKLARNFGMKEDSDMIRFFLSCTKSDQVPKTAYQSLLNMISSIK